ncbi:deoxyribonuclease IV [Bifidobacterium parmae]|uniref:Probable endonuclease 4 n=1 Tax=Bifidobacterium parmae TaxID=361854 RepID=A0A2N5IWT1_9BIFI|nr:deoxyribonuclease IV [Bifidobacterium parmae]PLS26407.1 endonuclease IV [Bifidobacterium parmae]
MTELLIGSHLSTAGGWDKLIERSHAERGTTFAFFPRSPYGRRSKALDPDGAAAFGARLAAEHYGPLVVHAPYVYNLAGKDPAKRAFAIDALAEDLHLLAPIRAAGQETYLNIHPGSHVGQGAETGCRLIAEALDRVREQAAGTGITILLETMAGKGTECGRSFEELASIIDRLADSDNVGVTFDTCHVCDAGYDLIDDYDEVIRKLDDIIGLDKVKAIHANDSMYGLASHKDRHANIGDGKLGLPFFTRLVNDPRMNTLPMILETKETTPDTHREEIALLRGLRKN